MYTNEDVANLVKACIDAVAYSQKQIAALEAKVEKFTSTNNARDEICPQCGDSGLINQSVDPNSGKLCPLCTSGKLSPVA